MGLRCLAFSGFCSAAFPAANYRRLRQNRTRRSYSVKQEISEEQRKNGLLIGAVIAFLLLALPVAVWLDLTEAQQDGVAPAGRRSQFSDHERAQLLRLQRGRAGAGQSRREHEGCAQLRIGSRRHPDSGDAVAGARTGDRRPAGEHHLPLRLGLPVPEPRVAPARQVRKGRARCASPGSRAEDRGDRDFAVQ